MLTEAHGRPVTRLLRPALHWEGWEGTGQPSSQLAGRWWDPSVVPWEKREPSFYFKVAGEVAGRHRAWGLQELLPGVRATVLCLRGPGSLRARLLPGSGRLLSGTVTEEQNRPSKALVSTWKPCLVFLVCRSSRLESVDQAVLELSL